VILDTNGLSAIAEGEAALEPILRKAAQIAIPVIVLGEYRYGISQSRHRLHYERWLAEYLPKFRVLDVDERTTISYSAVRTELKKAGTPIPSNDVWIAALCRQHSLPLISRDRHFDAVSGITRLAW
jgi:predicted nucleic acid-binding protein